MSAEKDTREPIDVLYDIERQVTEIGELNPVSQLEPRIDPQPGSNRYELLRYIQDNEPVKTAELKSVTGTSTTRVLTTLYYTYAVDREQKDGGYEYSITELGEKIMSNSQQTLDESESKTEPETPWEDTPLNRGQYKLLNAIHEFDGHPAFDDVCKTISARISLSENSMKPYLSALADENMIGKTPKPKMYYVTEKGKKTLQS